MTRRIFLKISHDLLPQAKDKYPFLYLERGRVEVDDSSVKWIDCDGQVIPLPVATINSIFLGPGTSITHEAIKSISSANCCVLWVSEDALIFYASGISPTATTKNIKKQTLIAADQKKSLNAARLMFLSRFPDADVSNKSLKEMMGMEGHRVRSLYEQKANQYQVGWKGRAFQPGKFEMSDLTNQILTSCNAALYGICATVIHAMGYSPHIGFVHSGSPLPFVYDIADLYKEHHCVDLAFFLTKNMNGTYDRHSVSEEFRKRVIDQDLLSKIASDINRILEV